MQVMYFVPCTDADLVKGLTLGPFRYRKVTTLKHRPTHKIIRRIRCHRIV